MSDEIEKPLFFEQGKDFPIILAPMAGVTDTSFRGICSRMGADFSYTEMVSAKAVCFGDRKTPVLARICADEGPCAVQIFGSEP
ncbi:MAG: tRNA-dihydrouridine synthase, partial [Parabacteroides sp.]|nr:tRNA-dihydrouridine synthase [Parabacteroides sp.]